MKRCDFEALRGSYNGFALSRVCRWVPQHYDASKTGHCLLQEFEQSGAELWQIEEDSSDVAAGMRKTFQEAAFDRVKLKIKGHDRNICGGSAGRNRHGRATPN